MAGHSSQQFVKKSRLGTLLARGNLRSRYVPFVLSWKPLTPHLMAAPAQPSYKHSQRLTYNKSYNTWTKLNRAAFHGLSFDPSASVTHYRRALSMLPADPAPSPLFRSTSQIFAIDLITQLRRAKVPCHVVWLLIPAIRFAKEQKVCNSPLQCRHGSKAALSWSDQPMMS